jgi:Mg2+ and Co2+ transporter CorA
MLNLKGFKGVARRALVREHRIYCNGQSNEITKTFEKLTSDALSQFAGRMAKTSETLFDYLVPREKKSAFFPRDKRKMFLPISALSIESKKRIYGLFSSIISEELAEINEIRNNLTYADKLVKPLNEMLHDLRRYFSIKDTSSNAEKIIILKAAASEARESYYKLKEELQNASPTKDTTRLENRLRKAQNEVATLASAIQTLEQTVLIESKK